MFRVCAQTHQAILQMIQYRMVKHLVCFYITKHSVSNDTSVHRVSRGWAARRVVTAAAKQGCQKPPRVLHNALLRSEVHAHHPKALAVALRPAHVRTSGTVPSKCMHVLRNCSQRGPLTTQSCPGGSKQSSLSWAPAAPSNPLQCSNSILDCSCLLASKGPTESAVRGLGKWAHLVNEDSIRGSTHVVLVEVDPLGVPDSLAIRHVILPHHAQPVLCHDYLLRLVPAQITPSKSLLGEFAQWDGGLCAWQVPSGKVLTCFLQGTLLGPTTLMQLFASLQLCYMSQWEQTRCACLLLTQFSMLRKPQGTIHSQSDSARLPMAEPSGP